MSVGQWNEAGAARRPLALSLLGHPAFWLAAFLAFVLAGLALPWRLPLGANAWDTAVYLDAVYRIRLGQAPNLDYFAPVGPLGYYLAATLEAVFPQAQPMLLANWALLPVLLPVMALIVAQVAARSRGQALALLLPFLLFAALPINLQALYPSPGFDGYGHYNRHVALLLYALIAALLFLRGGGLRLGLIAGLMLALVLVKVTGALAGALLVGYAVLVGRIGLREAIFAALATIAALTALDLSTGLVYAYAADIVTLLGLNTGSLLPRILTVASTKLNVVLPCLALIGVLARAAWRAGPPRTFAQARALADTPLGWLGAGLLALAMFETQNTGSLEFIGLWPILLIVLGDWHKRADPLRPVVLVLALAVALPSAVIAVERGGRAVLGAAGHARLDLAPIGSLGRVSVKREIVERARIMLAHYAAHSESYRNLAAKGVLPSYILFSEIDYQAAWLMELEQGAAAIRAWEAQTGRRLDSLLTLDFADAMNRVLARSPPRHVPVGPDPGRTTPPLTPEVLAELAQTDAILAPKCPPTTQRAALAVHYAPALQGRRLVPLSPCWDMHLSP